MASDERQRPGSAWVLVPSHEREVKRLYWKEFGETEIWIRLTPRAPNTGSPIPSVLVFSVVVRGDVRLPLHPQNAAPAN